MEGENLNADEKRHRFMARHKDNGNDEAMLNVPPPPLCSVERGTQTSPRPLLLASVAPMTPSQGWTPAAPTPLAFPPPPLPPPPPPPPPPAAAMIPKHSVPMNTVQQRLTVEEDGEHCHQQQQQQQQHFYRMTPSLAFCVNKSYGHSGNNNNRQRQLHHHQWHFDNDCDDSDDIRQRHQRAKWRQRVVQMVAQRQHQNGEEERHQEHQFGQMCRQKWSVPSVPTKATTVEHQHEHRQQQQQQRHNHFGTKTRSFDERPAQQRLARVQQQQQANAWRQVNKFVPEEWGEMMEMSDNKSGQYAVGHSVEIRGTPPFPAPLPSPPRRPRHAHLQRFFRSADAASASSTTTTTPAAAEEDEEEQDGGGCGGCSSTVSSSSSNNSSSSTTMPTMEEGRRMMMKMTTKTTMAPFWGENGNSSRQLYRSVDADDDHSHCHYGHRNPKYGRHELMMETRNHQRRFLPDVPTSSGRKMPSPMGGHKFSAPSSTLSLLPYNNRDWRNYRMPLPERSPPLARLNSLKRVAVAPPSIRRDFSVDRRTESLFRHFVRRDLFEIL